MVGRTIRKCALRNRKGLKVVKCTGKHWVRHDKRKRIWKKALEGMLGSEAAQTARARQRSWAVCLSIVKVSSEGHSPSTTVCIEWNKQARKQWVNNLLAVARVSVIHRMVLFGKDLRDVLPKAVGQSEINHIVVLFEIVLFCCAFSEKVKQQCHVFLL